MHANTLLLSFFSFSNMFHLVTVASSPFFSFECHHPFNYKRYVYMFFYCLLSKSNKKNAFLSSSEYMYKTKLLKSRLIVPFVFDRPTLILYNIYYRSNAVDIPTPICNKIIVALVSVFILVNSFFFII